MISFAEFFKKAPFAILVVVDDAIVDCNPAVLELIKIRAKKEIVGKNVGEIIQTKVGNKLEVKILSNHSSPDSPEQESFKGILSYKKLVREVIVSVVSEEAGVMTDTRTYLVVMPDPDRKESEQQKEPVPTDMFSSFLESSPDVIMEFDKELRHIYVNRKAAEQTGIPVKDFIGKTHHELNFPPALTELFDQSLRKVFDTGKENRIQFDLNSEIAVDWFLVPQFDANGEVKTVKTTARDISDLKKTQEALLDSQKKLLNAMKLSKLAFWTYDIVEDSLFLSAQFGLIIGEDWKKGHFLKLREYIKKYIYPADQERILAAVQQGEASGFSLEKKTFEYRLVNKDGLLISLFNVFSVKSDKQGKPVLLDGIIQDISLLRSVEAELRDYHDNLEKLIAQRTEELRRSEKKLSDALKFAKLTTWEFDFRTKKYYAGGEIEEILVR